MPEVDLFAFERGCVTAPAGCGKTQLIADTLVRHARPKPILILTHTNAGIAALRLRLHRAHVPNSSYKLTTIDGFARTLAHTFPIRSGLDRQALKLGRLTDYEAVRTAAGYLLKAGHVSEIMSASYSRLIVDEYQDCSQSQHKIVDSLGEVLPTCVLGDPMQAIFNIGGNQVVNWNLDVLARFPSAGTLETPWRWRNSQTEGLGQWLLACRKILDAGGPIDLRAAPREVTWIPITPTSAHAQRTKAARTPPPTRDGTVLVIGDSKNAKGRRRIASQTPGAINVEPADLDDLAKFSVAFDLAQTDSVTRLITFAGELMTNVGASALERRVKSLRQGTARNPPTPAEHALVFYATEPSYVNALQALNEIRGTSGVRVYRPDIFRSCLSAMQAAHDGSTTFHEAAERERERCRHTGRSVARRSVGSTLLLKGLEADVAVILYPELMDSRHLYVALTRGARRVLVCSQSPILTPIS
jgi:hypothetical protein